jgi:Calcium-activated chloride channel.
MMKNHFCNYSQIGFGRGDQSSEDIGYVLFSLFNVVWFSIYLEAWKRYSSELAYKWGTLDQRHELLMEPRPLYSVSTCYIVPIYMEGI